MATKDIGIKVSAQDEASAQLKKIGDTAKQQFDTIRASLERSVEASRQFAISIGLISAGVAAFGVESINAYNESERALAQLGAVIKSTGGAAGVTKEQAVNLAAALQQTTSVSDEAIIGAESMLLTFTKIGKDVFPDATKAAIDMATAMNGGATPSAESLRSTSIQLGKALNDPVNGINALRRVGVSFDEHTRKHIENLVRHNKTMEAQKIILAELAKEFGGSATEASKTFGGQLELLKQNFNDFQELIGKALTDHIRPMILAFNEWFQSIGGADGMFKLFSSTLASIQPYLAEIAGAIAGMLAPAFLSAAAAVGSMLLTLAPFAAAGVLIVDLAKEIAREFGITWPMIQQAVADSITAIKAKIEELHVFYNNSVRPALAMVARWFKENWNEIQSIIQGVGSVISGIIEGMVSAWNGILRPALATLVSWVRSHWSEIRGAIETTGDAIKEIALFIAAVWDTILKPALKELVKFFQNNGSTIIAIWDNFWKVIGKLFAVGTDILRGDWKKLWDDLKGLVISAASGLYAAVQVIMEGFAQIFTDGMNAAIDIFKNFMLQIGEMFANLGAEARQWGENMIKGFTEGVTNAIGGALSAVSGFANSVTDTVKGALQIHSPSKVFESLGDFTIQGFAIGMQKASHLPKKAAEELREKLRDEFKKLKDDLVGLEEDYLKSSNTIKETLGSLQEEHKKKWDGMASDIDNSREAIRQLKAEYNSFVQGQGNDFGSKLVQTQQDLGKAMEDLDGLRLTGGSDADIRAAQDKVNQLKASIEEAKSFYLGSKEDEVNKIAELEASLAEKQRALQVTGDLEKKAQIAIDIQDLQTKIDFSKLMEQNFADNQRQLAEGVARAKTTANMSEMQIFLLNLQQKRVQENNATQEKIKAEEDKIKVISDAMVQELNLYTTKVKEIKTRQDIMYNLHKEFMENSTKKTKEEVEKQIEFFHRLAEAAQAAAAAKMSVGVASSYGGGRASGGGVTPGTVYTVGERGPETFIPDQRGSILPTSKTGSAGDTINININGGSFLGSAEEIGDAIFNIFRLQQRT